MDENPNNTVASVDPSGPPPAGDEDWSGRAIGEFQILRLLGRGGMGQVYLAEQTSLRRKVAIKMLRPELAANRTALQRFRAEAEAVAKLTHANIVQIYAVGEQDGVHYMALEYVEGRNLRDYLNRKGPPDLAVCLSLMRQVANGVQRAHEAGFIHRDIKPENILLTRKGEAKVTDFGLSRCFTDDAQKLNLTQSGVAMGTPLYMSPEQVQGRAVDPRSDVYSFGVTCYHLLAGSPPFRGASAFDVAVQHVQNEPPPLAERRPDLPPDLCAMVHKMMAKNPDERYQSFKEVLRELSRMREVVTGATTLAPLPLPSSGSMKANSPTLSTGFSDAPTEALATGRNRWFLRGVAAVALVGVLIGGITVRLIRHRLAAKEQSPPASAAVEKPAPVISGEERFAQEAARQYADPSTTELRELKKGLDFQIDLLVYFFKRNRLDDVEAFCRELGERKYKSMPRDAVHPYRALADLGQALVLAFRDQVKALDLLGKQIQTVPRPGMIVSNVQIGGAPAGLFDHPELRRLIVEALNRLAINLKVEKLDKYPQLEALRKPSGPGNRPFPFPRKT